MAKPLYFPRAKLFHRQPAKNQAMLVNLVTRDLMQSTVAAPAKALGVRFTELGEDKTVVQLASRPKWADAGVNQWLQLEHSQARLYRDNARRELERQREEELQKEAPDQEIVDSKNAAINQLRRGGQGYLEEVYGLMASNARGVFWRLAAPNIPVRLRSNFVIEKNRALCFRLQRSLPPQGQAELYGFTIEFGNGTTQYAIEMGADGNQSTFVHYRNRPMAERRQLLDQRESLLDRTRLTAHDVAQIDDLEAVIKEARAAKEEHGGVIAGAQQRIEQIKAAKSRNLTASEQDELDRLENDLYLEREPFKLQEDAESLLGRTVDITIEFLRAGYVVVRCDNDTFVYENTRLTGAKPYGYKDGLRDKSRVWIHSDGGQFALVYGHPQYAARGVLLTQDFPVPFAPDTDEMGLTADADQDGDGCAIGYRFKTHQEPKPTARGAATAGRYQVEITLSGNGRYTPELFAAQLHIPAPLPDSLELLWDSQTDGMNPHSNSGNHILDFLLQDDQSRSRQITLHIDNAFGKSALPVSLAGLAVEAVLDNGREMPVTLMRSGRVVNSYQGDRPGFGGQTEIGPGGVTVLTCVGLESFCDREIEAPLIGDGKYPNDYLRALCRDAGLTPEEYASIPAGDVGLPKIGRSVPGAPPAVQPAAGVRYWEWMQQIAERHCIGHLLFYNGTSLELAPVTGRDKTLFNYRLPPAVSVEDRQCLRGRVSLQQSLGDYVTQVTCVGAEDPLTRRRIRHTESIPQAGDKRFLGTAYYIGAEIRVELPPDDGITEKRDLILMARNRLKISALTPHGATPWFMNATLDFDPELRAGDLRRVFDRICIVDTIEFGSLNANEGESMNVKFQLAQDF